MVEDREDEMQQVYDEPVKPKTLDSETLRAPVSLLARPKPWCVTSDTPIGAAVRLLQEKHIGAVLVVDQFHKLVGIFSERDVIQRVAGKRLDWDAVPVSTVMTHGPEFLRMHDMIAYALNYMHLGGYRHVPVVNDEHEPIGIVSIKDVVAYLADYFPQEVCNLPPEPLRLGPSHRHGG
jgi:CBS domain-containing protein